MCIKICFGLVIKLKLFSSFKKDFKKRACLAEKVERATCKANAET